MPEPEASAEETRPVNRLDRRTFLGRAAGLAVAVTTGPFPRASGAEPRWSEKANAWYAQQPWLVGSNYIPRTAINQLEMWQAETFDLDRIDRELGWAEGLGMNTMRVFLHDLLWQQDAAGFRKRIDQFLAIAASTNQADVRAVRFASGIRSRSWASSARRSRACTTRAGCRAPAPTVLQGPEPASRASRRTCKGSSARSPRTTAVLAWDVWNEPDNMNAPQLRRAGAARTRSKLVLALLPQGLCVGPLRPAGRSR